MSPPVRRVMGALAPIVVGPGAAASTQFERACFDEPTLFWTRFAELNRDTLASKRPVLVFRGSDQGLGNNLVAMLGALVLSVVSERAFRYDWRNGGQVRDIGELLDTPLQSYQSLIDEAKAAGEAELARVDAASERMANMICSMDFGTPLSTNAIRRQECYDAMLCDDFWRRKEFISCEHMAITGNFDVTPFFEDNPHMLPTWHALFGPVVGLLAHRVAPKALAPSAAVRESISAKLRRNAPNWNPKEALGVHLRTVRVPAEAAIERIVELHERLGTESVFLATDNEEVRNGLRKRLGSALIFLDDYKIGDVENATQRAATVRIAWEESNVVASTRFKALSLSYPASSFSNFIYHLSADADRVYDLATGSEHPTWRHVQEKRNPKLCPMRNYISACRGEFRIA